MEVMEESKKKRGENWSSEEKELLRQLIGSSANIIEDRCTNTTTNLKKGNEWKNIMIRFNELTGKSRSTEQLKLAWKRMKLSAKSNISSHMRALNTTGGGCKPPLPSPGDLQIMSIAPHDFLIEVNDYDSDAVVSNLAKATTSKEIYVDPKPGPDLENQTIVEEKKLLNEHNIIEVENKSLTLVQPPALEAPNEGHAAQCTCPNCDELLSRFSECSICLEPLQCCGPCVCPWCGGVWCARCSRRMSRCAWCRGSLRAPAAPCLALQRLINDLMLPCRNYRRGCTELLTSVSRVKHEEECKFDTMMCPITANCCSVPFEELSTHLQSSHNIIAVYSQKIKILIENFQTKLKKTACCRTKYKIILLHQKSAFIIKVCIYNYHVRVEVMRRKLGYIADVKAETKKSEYCALVEFQSKALCTKSAILIENEAYGKKAEVQWNDVIMKSDVDEAITIHVNIAKSDSDLSRKNSIES